MKKLFLTFVFAIVATLTAMAQQISVVSTTGATTLYRTLQEAIEGADSGSVIYLPGGSFVSDNLTITKKLTIIGVGYKSNNDNVDGITTIVGNIRFDEGASGSALIGCYITERIMVGYGNNHNVSDMLIKNCRLKWLMVGSNCMRTIVSQNYITGSQEINSDAYINNNVTGVITNLKGGTIINNIIYCNNDYHLYKIYNTTIVNNIMIGYGRKGYLAYYDYIDYRGANCQVSNNLAQTEVGDDCITIGETEWTNVFANYSNTISPNNDYHFKGIYKQYENQVGIYADSGFSERAPVPYIVAKHVDEQTDASGKLNVKIRVKASE